MCTKLKPFTPCRKCKDLSGPKPGYYYKNVNNFQTIIECKCHSRWRLEQELERKLENSNLVSDYTFDDYRGTRSLADLEALKSIAQDPERFIYKKVIYVQGSNGVQKTSMCTALGRELIKKGYTAQYVLMQDLMNNLIKSFNDSDQEMKDAFIKRCLDVDYLIIDECFDKSKVTLFQSGYQLPFLDNFIRTRVDINKKSLILISNKKPSEIAAQGFGDSLQNFIIRTTQGSLLIFEDEYSKNVEVIDRLSLFKRG